MVRYGRGFEVAPAEDFRKGFIERAFEIKPVFGFIAQVPLGHLLDLFQGKWDFEHGRQADKQVLAVWLEEIEIDKKFADFRAAGPIPGDASGDEVCNAGPDKENLIAGYDLALSAFNKI